MADRWDHAATGNGASHIVLEAYEPPDESTIPMREWVVEGIALRRHLSLIVGSGGMGKSSLGITAALSAVIRHHLGRFQIPAKMKVAFLSMEEDSDETNRRFAAACKHLHITKAQLRGRLFRFRFTSEELQLIARPDGNGGIEPTEALADMSRAIEDNGIDLIILDPFVELWEGNENDNQQVKAVAAFLRRLARTTNSACMLIHHVRKGLVVPGDIDASRGGSALGNTARLMFTLTQMTADMAKVLGIDEDKANGKLRLDAAKGNYIPKDAATDWFEFVNVKLDNGPKFLPEGDGVGVLVPWQPPGMFAGIATATITKALALIDAGLVDDNGVAGSDRYNDDARSSRWAGSVVMSEFGWSEERAKAALKQWLKTGILVKHNHKGSDRHVRTCLKVDPDKYPGLYPGTA